MRGRRRTQVRQSRWALEAARASWGGIFAWVARWELEAVKTVRIFCRGILFLKAGYPVRGRVLSLVC
ncbi:MAG: hypothetical protein KatS3mg110_3915 [Pirellulaceae bacterium]|nr:MAG: hypothetical protein KatS3mg110_3915 [Pirellulaceae bacterium]